VVSFEVGCSKKDGTIYDILLEKYGLDVISRDDAGIPTDDIEETGATFEENSYLKARTIFDMIRQDSSLAKYLDSPVIADDSGLMVDAMDGAPGVFSARYAGEGKDFNANMDKDLSELQVLECEANMASNLGLKVKKVSRRARFKSVITLIIDGQKHFFEGALEGIIAYEKSGNGGFGYDPIFIADEYPGQTLADISEEQKNEISHRGKALRAMAAWLSANSKP
jgi:XTP/dITP diphosphohydrolase